MVQPSPPPLDLLTLRQAPFFKPVQIKKGVIEQRSSTLTVPLTKNQPYLALEALEAGHEGVESGEIYYINWETGVRTTEDPRAPVPSASALIFSYYYSDEDEYNYASHIGSGDDFKDDDDDEEEGDSSSSLSSESPPRASAIEDAVEASGGYVLIVTGCMTCFMYFMVPKRVNAYPKCDGGLLHLGRNGCV
ncbi:hypothetical protein Cni_G16117 [Canna indica]|uniref:Uncharacterized protein n=1 Tax=Canna indica TaxID=4628 RepID=A0AAQ3KKJ5_9LILI|nr:hypothetical protein Cni_G16117 [Canna indica]